MKSIQQAMLEEIYINADAISKKNRQVLQEAYNFGKGEFYITLQQLESILKGFEE